MNTDRTTWGWLNEPVDVHVEGVLGQVTMAEGCTVIVWSCLEVPDENGVERFVLITFFNRILFLPEHQVTIAKFSLN